jgi:hypothetical protein
MPLGCSKARRLTFEINEYFQLLIASVLFPRSQELWRMWGRERRNSALPPFQQSGASREEARKYWGFSLLEF